MLAPCLLCLVLLPPTDGPIARAARTAFSQHVTDAGRVQREAERRARERADDRDRLNYATWVYAATAGADWAVTAACAEAPCRRHVGLFLHGVKRPAAIPIGLVIDAALGIGIREFVAPDHPRIAEVALYVLSGARLVVMTHKISEIRDREAGR